MKLVRRKDFLKLPEGTVYFDASKCDGQIIVGGFGDLHIKGESIGNVDYIHNNINHPYVKECNDDVDIIDSWNLLIDGKEVDFSFDEYERDGMYDETAEYFVLDKVEVKSLISVLTDAYNKINE